MESSCYKTSNNKYFDSPPRMDDARHFTDYSSNSQTNNILRSNNNISDNNDYRKFLTDNAEKLMNLNRTYSCQKNCSKPCKYNNDIAVPHHSEIVCNNSTCNVTELNPEGIGLKVNYGHEQNCKDWPESVSVNQPCNRCNRT